MTRSMSRKSMGTPVSKRSGSRKSMKKSSSFKSPIFISKRDQVPIKNQILNSKFELGSMKDSGESGENSNLA